MQTKVHKRASHFIVFTAQAPPSSLQGRRKPLIMQFSEIVKCINENIIIANCNFN